MTWSVIKYVPITDGAVKSAIISAINAIEDVPNAPRAQLNAAKRAAEACASSIECEAGKQVFIQLSGHGTENLSVSVSGDYCPPAVLAKSSKNTPIKEK